MARLASLLYFDAMATARVLVNKDRRYMACLRFRGPDLHSSLDSALIVQADLLNNIVMRLGAGWGVLSEDRRAEVCDYPTTTTWQYPTARLVDEERAQHFRTPGEHYANTTTLTLTYKAPKTQALAPRWKRAFYTHLPTEPAHAHVGRFEEDVRRVLGMLRDCCETAKWLEGEELLTYLHSTVSWKTHAVAVPNHAAHLDTYLADMDLERVWVPGQLGRWPRLGGQYLRCVSAQAYPPATVPGMLEVLEELPMEYRACERYLPMTRQQAVREAQKYGDSHYGKRTRDGRSQGRVEMIALDYSDEASQFQRGIEHGRYSAGQLTQTVVVWDADFAQATEKAEQVEQALNAAKYTAKVERANTRAAWEGTIPGNVSSNCRRVTMTSENLAHLFPATAPMVGPSSNAHLGGPCLLRVTGRNRTPVNLDPYEDDLGHMFIIGPPGAGKSFFLATEALQWLQYPRAHVYAFDKDQSMRCMTYAVGGRWHDLGSEVEALMQRATALEDLTLWGNQITWTLPEGHWHCFETDKLLKMPTVLPQVLTPLCRDIEGRMHGQPVQLIFDEGWRFLNLDFFRGKIQDYLLTVRKMNGMWVFSTQNINHILESPIGSDIFQACPSRIYLANRHAIEPESARLYQGLGLNERQVEIIAHLIPKRTYYVQGPHGCTVFDLGAGPINRAFAGSSRKEDLAAMDRLYQGDGAQFAREWLTYKGLPEAAARLQQLQHEMAGGN
jgi:type IV secretory pathway VirB4 component